MLEDGTSLFQIDMVLLVTGNELPIPFLSFICNMSVSAQLPDPDACEALTDNGPYP